ncbi:glycoside hydrolase family 73 protein [Paenibacillus thermotolerans]|uniref:glycoside hydrolase family 73 protein n=1 Tax=Paenibacillus thermotolerans TaxID=3027807 RepID=UPI00236807C2|nr:MULTISPECIES: glucosaminidase domain-containing protein [unclassified Paenibacillus]
MNRQQFIDIVAPVAVKVRVDGGVLFPSVSLAQAILETGGNIPSWNNIVGYKVGSGTLTEYWHGRSVSAKTWEVYGGSRYDNITANWRAYDNIEDCLKDQALLFLNNRLRYYQVIGARSPAEQANALQMSGYATDPLYASKIIALIRSGGYEKYDKEAEEGMEAIKEMQAEIAELRALVRVGPPPVWAKPTVDKLVAKKLLSDPTGDISFFRALVVLDRAGAFDNVK